MGIFGSNTPQITQTLNYKRQTTSHGLSGKTDLKVLYEVTFQLLPNQYSIPCIPCLFFVRWQPVVVKRLILHKTETKFFLLYLNVF